MKFLLFIVIVVSIWYVMRWLQQADVTRRVNEQRARDRRNTSKAENPHKGAVDTVICTRCRAYIPANRPTACGRGDCPYPIAG